MDIEKAIQFVKDNGNEVEQARLRYILAGERPSELIKTTLFAQQRLDGGWAPFWADDYSSLDATCFRLAQAEQLGINEFENAVRAALNFLADRQSPDGSWEEYGEVADAAPPWALPGDLSSRLYLTANCGLWMALLGNPGDRASKAAEYLRTYLDEDGHLPGFTHTHWLAGGLWYKLDWQDAERVFESLAKRISDLAPSHLAWLLTTMCAAGVPASHYLIKSAVPLLERSQRNGGYWESEDDPGFNVHVTLEALRALRLCGRDV